MEVYRPIAYEPETGKEHEQSFQSMVCFYRLIMGIFDETFEELTRGEDVGGTGTYLCDYLAYVTLGYCMIHFGVGQNVICYETFKKEETQLLLAIYNESEKLESYRLIHINRDHILARFNTFTSAKERILALILNRLGIKDLADQPKLEPRGVYFNWKRHNAVFVLLSMHLFTFLKRSSRKDDMVLGSDSFRHEMFRGVDYLNDRAKSLLKQAFDSAVHEFVPSDTTPFSNVMLELQSNELCPYATFDIVKKEDEDTVKEHNATPEYKLKRKRSRRLSKHDNRSTVDSDAKIPKGCVQTKRRRAAES